MPGRQFGDGARHQRPDDPVADAMERILDVALAELNAPLVGRPADRQLQRAVDDLDDLVPQQDLVGMAGIIGVDVDPVSYTHLRAHET